MAQRFLDVHGRRETDRDGEVMQLLVNVAHRRKAVAQKNAAIALAKLAKYEYGLQRIRELRAVEVILAYMPKG